MPAIAVEPGGFFLDTDSSFGTHSLELKEGLLLFISPRCKREAMHSEKVSKSCQF